MKDREVAIGQGGDRGRRGQDLDATGCTGLRRAPAGEGERDERVSHHELGDPARADHDSPGRERVEWGVPAPPVGRPRQATSAAKAFRSEPPIQLAGPDPEW